MYMQNHPNISQFKESQSKCTMIYSMPL